MRETVLDYDEAVLGVVSLIPAGTVLTYGDIAEILERGGPRQVGAVMARGSVDLPWWRVLRADGKPPQGLEAAAVEHYREESIPLRAVGAGEDPASGHAGYRVDLVRSRWRPTRDEEGALQDIRAGLQAGVPGRAGGATGLSEADAGVGP